MPRTFTVTVNLDGDAFQPDPARELGDILDHVRRQIMAGTKHYGCYQTILDSNGNDVGRWRVPEVGGRP